MISVFRGWPVECEVTQPNYCRRRGNVVALGRQQKNSIIITTKFGTDGQVTLEISYRAWMRTMDLHTQVCVTPV